MVSFSTVCRDARHSDQNLGACLTLIFKNLLPQLALCIALSKVTASLNIVHTA